MLYMVPQLAPQVARWGAGQEDGAETDRQKRSDEVINRAWRISRRDGALSGSSLFVGVPAAMASLFCHQIVMVLRIAALYGRDPSNPARAAEVLLLQGRFDSAEAARRALRVAGARPARGNSHKQSRWTTIVSVVRQLPSMIGLRLRTFRHRSLLDRLISIAQLAFYSGGAATPAGEPGFSLPAPARPATRRRFAALVAVLGVAIALVVALLLHNHGGIGRWIGAIVIALYATMPFGLLLWITRSAPRSTQPAERAEATDAATP